MEKVHRFSILELARKIEKEIPVLTEPDRKVLRIVNSFWACGEQYTKEHLLPMIREYIGCKAWEIAFNYTYMEN